jgi:hypothetical protein
MRPPERASGIGPDVEFVPHRDDFVPLPYAGAAKWDDLR